MKITQMKINGITQPLGFRLQDIYASWIVEDTSAQTQKSAMIEVAKDVQFEDIVFQNSGEAVAGHETSIDIKLEPYTRYYWRVMVCGDNDETAVSETAWFETAKEDTAWSGEWIGASEEEKRPIVLKRTFELSEPATKSRLYMSGLGLYEVYLDGEKIGNEYLTPGCNDYRYQIQYQTYDPGKLDAGTHELMILLGSGWYMGRFGLHAAPNQYGNQMAAIAELHLEQKEKKCVIGTDRSWEYTISPITNSGIYDGEVWDAAMWDMEKPEWKEVQKVLLPLEHLCARYSLQVVEKEKYHPQQILHTAKGDTVLDMGQNMVGFVSFTDHFQPGTQIRLEFGEVLQEDEFYNENYRSANGGFTYIAAGDGRTARAHFTYFGFRYIRVTGWEGEVKKEDITAHVIYSDLERTGYFASSNEKINRLYENSLWSQKSNFVEMPTDCPQRDERLGWTGDAQVFTTTASYHMDTRAFYEKFLQDLHIEQERLGGAVPNFIPNLENEKDVSSVWGDAATFMPAYLYRMYGSMTQLRTFYPMMKQWVDHITGLVKKGGNGHLFLPGFCFGDWLAQDGVTPNSFKGGTDDGYISSVYYYQSARYVAEAAGKLHKKEDSVQYQQLARAIRSAILDEYFSKSGRLAVDNQAAYIIALAFGIYVDKEKLIEQFRGRLAKDCYRIKCGFVGAPLLCKTLAECGMMDLAYTFLLREEFPSWLYCVNHGATTIWERWNSLGEDGKVSPTGMNSFNHYAYGSIVEFLYAYVAGIRPYKEGFAEVILAPKLHIKMSSVRAEYTSAWGRFRVSCELREDGKIQVHIEIPFGTTAHVRLPEYEEKEMLLGAGSYDYCYEPKHDLRKCFGGHTRLEDLAYNEEAMQILREKLPILYGMTMGHDMENTVKSVAEFKYMGFLGIPSEVLEGAIDQLTQIVCMPR